MRAAGWECSRATVSAPVKCVVVEDAVNGIEAAKAAGMRCIAVAQSFGVEQLRRADLVRASVMEVSLDDFGAGTGKR